MEWGGILPPTKGADVLHKALNLIDLFESHRELGLSEVVHLTGMPKATVFRLLSALEMHHFLTRTGERQYRLGLRFLRLGARVAEALDIRRWAIPHMRTLRDQTGQSVHLVLIDGHEGVFVERFEGTTSVRFYVSVGGRAPLYAGASTRLLLAHCSPERQANILAANPPVAHTATTITSLDELRVVLDETRANGWTASLGELEPDSAEVAVPVFDYQGNVVAALGIGGQDSLYGADQIQGYLPLLKAAAEAISREMGYQ